MTCVVGLVGTGDEAGSVLLAADSAGVVRGQEIHSLCNQKVFRVGSYLLGFTTSFRLGQVVRFGSMLPDPPPEVLTAGCRGADLEGFLALGVAERFSPEVRGPFEVVAMTAGLGQVGIAVEG